MLDLVAARQSLVVTGVTAHHHLGGDRSGAPERARPSRPAILFPYKVPGGARKGLDRCAKGCFIWAMPSGGERVPLYSGYGWRGARQQDKAYCCLNVATYFYVVAPVEAQCSALGFFIGDFQ